MGFEESTGDQSCNLKSKLQQTGTLGMNTSTMFGTDKTKTQTFGGHAT